MEELDPPLSVLLVEDNPNDARLIRRYLERTRTAFLPDEVDLHHAETLEAGLDQLGSEPVDLLLLDLGLGATDGAETFERIREMTEELPVVVLTNLEDEQTAVELLQQGAQDYLSKGDLGEDQLIKSIRYALERQEQTRKLRTTTEQLEVLNRILRHDVRNDVQVLKLWSERLVEEVDEEHVEEIRRITETSDHIRELTDNTREFLEVVTGESDPDIEPVRLDELLREELEKARSAYAAAVFDIEGSLPAVSVSANSMLTSVFRNLLNNAVQHNDHRPYITVGVEVGDESVRVTVADDGPGVPDEKKEEIFGKGEHGLDSEGTGIGLHLVNTLVTGYGGHVHVEDNEPRGAAFVVELPKAETASWAAG